MSPEGASQASVQGKAQQQFETWTYQATRWSLTAESMLLLIIGGLIFAKGERWVR